MTSHDDPRGDLLAPPEGDKERNGTNLGSSVLPLCAGARALGGGWLAGGFEEAAEGLAVTSVLAGTRRHSRFGAVDSEILV